MTYPINALYGAGYSYDPVSDGYSDATTADTLGRMNALYAGPGGALRSLRNMIPENTEGGLSALNMLRSGLNTSANWLQGKPEIGPDTLAPLGLGSMGTGLANALTRASPDARIAQQLMREHPEAVAGGNMVRDARHVGVFDPDTSTMTRGPADIERVWNAYGGQARIARPDRQSFSRADNDGGRGPSLMADNARSSTPGTVANALDMSQEARLARAQEQGFDTGRTWHHGTDAEFNAFQPRTGGPYSGGSTVPATWMTSSPRIADAWAGAGGQPGRVIDAHVAAPNLEVVERGFRSPDWGTMDPILQRAKEAGKDGVLFKRSNDHPDTRAVDPRLWNASDVMAVFNPTNIRSTQAAFDPARRDSAMLLAADNARSSTPGTVVNAMGEQPQTMRAYHGSPYARPDGKLDASKINPDEPGFFFSNDPWLSSQYVKHGLAPMEVIKGAFDESLARGYMELLPDGRSRVVDRAAHDKLVREIEGSWLPNGANVTPVDIDPSKLRTIDLPGYRWDQDEGAKIAEAARAAKAEGYAGLNIRGMREGRDTRAMPDSQRPDVQTIWEPGHVKSATTGDTIFSSPSSTPGLAANATQPSEPDSGVMGILRKYGLSAE